MPRPTVTLTLFGPFAARFNGQPLANFATDKIRALFAYLAIESGKPHRRETLAGLLWPDYPDQTALRNVRQSLHRLRQTLHAAHPDLPDRLIARTRQTITLNPEAITLDTAQFSQLLQMARPAAEPIPLLTQAVALYQGELLQGFALPDAYAFDEWLTIQREVFHQQVLDALTRLTALHDARRDPEAVLASARHVITLEPWHEEAHRQIMRAHLRQGSRSQAIAQYHELRLILNRELGVEPSAATTALYQQVQAGAIPTPAPAGEPLPAPTQLQHFPALLTPLIGRKAELNHLVRTLQDPDCRLLTLTGPGGMGKTRLGVEAARRLAAQPHGFADGIVFIPLAQLDHASLLVATLAQSLDLTLAQSADPRQELLKHLKTKQLLLLLDNLEHLLIQPGPAALPQAISLLVDVLATAPGVTLFATSREPLNVQGEWLFPLDGLPYAPAGGEGGSDPLDQPAPQLFVHHARRYRPAFDPPAQAAAILEICRLTNGLPLALEMAAAWTRAYDCPEIAQRIAQSLDFLTSPYRDAPARQRSIRAVFASTWAQLTPEQQAVLAATSVFLGGFTIQAAIAVAQASVLDLAILVEKSLLRRAEERRYELHDLVRQFAAEKLAESGQAAAVQARHADFYFAFLAEQSAGFNGTAPQEAVAAVGQVVDNLRIAWQWAVAQRQIVYLQRAVDGWAQYLVLTGNVREGEAAFANALALLQQDGVDSPAGLSLQSRLASHLAWFQLGQGQSQAPLENAATALALAERSGDLPGRGQALSILGWALRGRGQFDQAEAALLEAVALFKESGDQLQLSLALIRLGSIHWHRGELEEALEQYQRSLQIETRLQNRRGINRAYGGIGLVYAYLGQYDAALVWLNKALALDREFGNRIGVARHLGNIGNTHFALGDYPQALQFYQEAVRIEQAADHKSTLAIWLASIASIYREMQAYDLALQHYDQTIALCQEVGNRVILCEALLGKAEVLLTRRELVAAKLLIEQGRQLADEAQGQEGQFRARLLQARWLAASGSPEAARQQLATLLTWLAEDADAERLACVYDELWTIGQAPEDARQALAAYRAAFARAPKALFRARIAALERSL